MHEVRAGAGASVVALGSVDPLAPDAALGGEVRDEPVVIPHAPHADERLAPPSGYRVEPRLPRATAPDVIVAPHEKREPSLDDDSDDEPDAERIAFKLWQEGRADDAIAFLEREILIEKTRLEQEPARVEPHFESDAAPAPVSLPAVVSSPVVPSSDIVQVLKPSRRSKRKSANRDGIEVSEPAFSDASAPMIDLTAESISRRSPADDLDPDMHAARIGRGPAWIAALGLVIVSCAAAANLWDNAGHQRVAATAASAVVATPPGTPARAAAPAAAAPSHAESSAAAPSAAPATPGTQTPKVEVADSDPAGTNAQPAEGDASPAPSALADASPSDEVPPPDEGADPDEAVPDDAAASADPDSAAPARLPRQRPEPPPQSTAVASAPAALSRPAHASPTTAANASPAPPEDDSAAGPPQPFYDAYGVPRRETLTPQEYQRLLERRAFAEDYAADQRAMADDPPPMERRALLRLLRR